MWHDLLVALALLMVVEGIIPFLSPQGTRRLMQAVSEMDNRSIRVSGLVSMILGVLALYIVN